MCSMCCPHFFLSQFVTLYAAHDENRSTIRACCTGNYWSTVAPFAANITMLANDKQQMDQYVCGTGKWLLKEAELAQDMSAALILVICNEGDNSSHGIYLAHTVAKYALHLFPADQKGLSNICSCLFTMFNVFGISSTVENATQLVLHVWKAILAIALLRFSRGLKKIGLVLFSSCFLRTVVFARSILLQLKFHCSLRLVPATKAQCTYYYFSQILGR